MGSEVKYNKIIDTINDFGFPYYIKSKSELNSYFEIKESDKISLKSPEGVIFIFDKSGNILHADQLSLLEFNKKENKSKKSNYPSKSFKEVIKSKYVDNEFSIEKNGKFTLDYKMASFYKANPADILNPYNQYRIVFNNSSDLVILYNYFNDFEIRSEAKINENQAKEIAKKFLKESKYSDLTDVTSIKLKVIKSNNFFESSLGNRFESSNNNFHLSYEIEFKDFIVYVEAINGKVIGGDSY